MQKLLDRVVRLMVFAADKPADAVLLFEKNTVPWLISRPDKFKRIHWDLHYCVVNGTYCKKKKSFPVL